MASDDQMMTLTESDSDEAVRGILSACPCAACSDYSHCGMAICPIQAGA